MKKVSDKIIRHQVRGMILPIDPGSNSPVFLNNNGVLFLPLFTSLDKFKEASEWGKFPSAQPNIIINPQDFEDCVFMFKKKFPFHVAIDPHLTPEGNTRFQLAAYDEEEKENLNGQ
jgi:hypothetical protein